MSAESNIDYSLYTHWIANEEKNLEYGVLMAVNANKRLDRLYLQSMGQMVIQGMEEL